MSQTEKLHAQIGQVKIGRPGQSLHAILGSCIGIGFIYRDKQIYGLAHCLLSKSNGAAKGGQDGRTVEQAVESLQKMMGFEDEERKKLRVFLAGGANMTLPPDTDPSRLVGNTNAKFAYKTVRSKGYRVMHEDVGGVMGRSVSIQCDTGDFDVSIIPRLGG